MMLLAFSSLDHFLSIIMRTLFYVWMQEQLALSHTALQSRDFYQFMKGYECFF
jgi:hypothetical protein